MGMWQKSRLWICHCWNTNLCWCHQRLKVQITWSPDTDLRVSTARTDPSSLWCEFRVNWKQFHKRKPSVVESALSSVDWGASNSGAVEKSKPFQRHQPPLEKKYLSCLFSVPGVDVETEYWHHLVSRWPDNLWCFFKVWLQKKILCFSCVSLTSVSVGDVIFLMVITPQSYALVAWDVAINFSKMHKYKD